jgi:hypothetical protein
MNFLEGSPKQIWFNYFGFEIRQVERYRSFTEVILFFPGIGLLLADYFSS